MKALIFNSGFGNRMGDFTKSNHKSMARLSNGETIFGRQLRILAEAGIKDFVVTTGPFAEQLVAVAAQPQFAGLRVTFVENPEHARTNYIYSMHLAGEHLDSDCLLLHGDLVFDAELVHRVLTDPRPDLAMFNDQLPQPEKDFKVRARGGMLLEVAVDLTGAQCHAFQPLYKLSHRALRVWLERVTEFVAAGRVQVYAENALNEVAEAAAIQLSSYAGHFLSEVDTPEDLSAVAAEIRRYDFRQQPIVAEARGYVRLGAALARLGVHRPLLVCGRSYDSLELKSYVDALDIEPVRFDDFSPNPTYEQVAAGVRAFTEHDCDGVLTIGGGSAIDVGKCVKLFAALDPDRDFLAQEPVYSPIKHVVIPTTAGTGSESTHFSVVYVDGRKRSVAHDSMLPDQVFVEPTVLGTLPDYQRRATLLDALCQCIESTWASKATAESQEYALAGIELILAWMFAYLRGGDARADLAIARAANLSGRAINLSQTTAPHAMSYALTTRYGIAHGHAVALCLPPVWRHWTRAVSPTADLDRATRFRRAEDALCARFGVAGPGEAIARFEAIVDLLGLPRPELESAEALDTLVESVNAERLANSPLPLDAAAIRKCYAEALAPVPALDTARTAEFETLVALDDFCDRYRLPYFLAGRTLLDAVVHGRLSPWSGPITVWLPRWSYLKLVRWRDQLPPGYLLDEATQAPGQVSRLFRSAPEGDPERSGILLRVLDSIHSGARPSQAARRVGAAVVHRLFAASGQERGGRGSAVRLVRGASRAVRPQDLHRFRRLAFAHGRKLPGEHIYLDPGFDPAFSRSQFPARWFDLGREVELDGRKFKAPLHAASVLTRLYGRDFDNALGIPVNAKALADARPPLAAPPEPAVAVAPQQAESAPLISVVVPVYNVEAYLRQCLDSLCQQDGSGYEIIAVNDGSPDGSPQILAEYADRYPELVRVFDKPNGGLSDARNFGLSHARGEYVAFVDADDLVAPSMIRLLGEKARSTDADIVVCRHSEYWADNERADVRWMSYLNSYGHSVHERPELLVAAHPYAWNKLYRRRLFTDHGIAYPKGQAFEDSATTFNLMLEANRIELVDEPLYFYRMDRPDSITNTFNRRFHDIFKSFDSIRSYYTAKGCYEEFREELHEIMRRTSFARVTALESCRDPQGVEEFLDAVYDYLDRHAPGWAQNKYFRRQMRNPKYRDSEKYRAMPNRQRMQRYFRKLWLNLGDDMTAASGYTTSELIRMLQAEELEILLEIDRVCRELGLTYYLAEGTLLGAVRHQGFIPWDDDVDIAMPRADYERLIEHLAGGAAPELRLFNERTYPRYHLTFTKVLSSAPSGFTNTNVTLPPQFQGPTVDIFPLDAAVRRRDLRLERRVRRLRDMLLFKVDFMSRRTRRAKFGTYLQSRFVSFGYLQDTIQRLYRLHERDPEAGYLANFASSYPVDREKVPAAAYGTPRLLPFAGHELPVPADWDLVLRTTYGAYLQLPPPEKQVPRHRPRWRDPNVSATTVGG